MPEHRNVTVSRDAVGNTIITGDGNVVVIDTHAVLHEEVHPETPIGPNPYNGLAAFDERETERFFGREALTSRLWGLFRNLHEPAPSSPSPFRVLPILGPSGSGKSSLARAGLIAELARRPLPAMSEPNVAVISPGAHPIEALGRVLARTATGDQTPVAKTREFARELRAPNDDGAHDGLRRIADTLPSLDASPYVVLIEQFEEVFSLCQDEVERRIFIENLLVAAGDPGRRVSIILTMRSDFLGNTVQHPEFNRIVATNGVIVPTMVVDELRRAVAEPAIRAGHPFDEATVDLLVSQTEGREGALPLLQFALTRIWDALADGTPTSETLQTLGGVGGALAREAERLFSGLSKQDQLIARRAFLALIHLGEGTRNSRRLARLSEIVADRDDPDHVLNVLRRFSRPGERLITLSGSDQSDVAAEVTHEALFDHWARLRTWVDENRNDIRFHRSLANAVTHWEAQGQAKGLLWRPPDLDLLRDYYRRARGEFTNQQANFFKASERQHRLGRSTRQGAVLALVTAIVVATWFAIDSERQRNVAEQEAERAGRAETTAKLRATEAEVQRARGQELSLENITKRALLLVEKDPLGGFFVALDAMRQGHVTSTKLPSELGEAVLQAYSKLEAKNTRPSVPVAVSATGDAVVFAEAEGGWGIAREDGTRISAQQLGTQEIQPSAFEISRDGALVLVSHQGGELTLHRFADGGRVFGVLENANPILATAVDPRSRYFAATLDGGQLYVWDREGNQVYADSMKSSEPVADLVFSVGGRELFILTRRGAVFSVAVPNSNGIQSIIEFDAASSRLALSEDGRLLAAATDDDGSVLIVDLLGRAAYRWLHDLWQVPITDVAFDPSGSRIFILNQDGKLHSRDLFSSGNSVSGLESLPTYIAGQLTIPKHLPLDVLLVGIDSDLRWNAVGDTPFGLMRYGCELSEQVVDGKHQIKSPEVFALAATIGNLAVCSDLSGPANEETIPNNEKLDLAGRTPLIRAVWLGKDLVVGEMIDHGADIDAKDALGMTALHHAAADGSLYLVNLLLSAGATPEPLEVLDRTPLFLAARGGHRQVIDRLVESGAQTNSEDALGITPVAAAKGSGHDDIASLLEQVSGAIVSGSERQAIELPYWVPPILGSDDPITKKAHELEKAAANVEDLRQATELYKAAAERGDSFAMYRLAKAFNDGVAVEADSERVSQYLAKALAAGNPYSKNWLAVDLLDEERDDQTTRRGFELLKEAASAGVPQAHSTLAWRLYEGNSVPKDVDAALVHAEIAANHQMEDAAFLLGQMIENEELPNKTIADAIHYYEAALSSGPEVKVRLGRILEQRAVDNNDTVRAFRLFLEAANDGAIEGMRRVGLSYLNGIGIERSLDKARAWIRRAALMGDQLAAQMWGKLILEKEDSLNFQLMAEHWFFFGHESQFRQSLAMANLTTRSLVPFLKQPGSDSQQFIEYDDQGRLSAIKAGKKVLHIERNFKGMVASISTKDAIGGQQIAQNRYIRDDRGRFVQVATDSGFRLRVTYDGSGRVSQLAEEVGSTVSIDYSSDRGNFRDVIEEKPVVGDFILSLNDKEIVSVTIVEKEPDESSRQYHVIDDERLIAVSALLDAWIKKIEIIHPFIREFNVGGELTLFLNELRKDLSSHSKRGR